MSSAQSGPNRSAHTSSGDMVAGWIGAVEFSPCRVDVGDRRQVMLRQMHGVFDEVGRR